MSTHSYIALVGLGLPAVVLLAGAAILFRRTPTVPACLQLVGTVGLLVVVLTHAAEALRLFPSMGWGLPRSVGHYLDLWSAVLALTCFPVGYLIHALTHSPLDQPVDRD